MTEARLSTRRLSRQLLVDDCVSEEEGRHRQLVVALDVGQEAAHVKLHSNEEDLNGSGLAENERDTQHDADCVAEQVDLGDKGCNELGRDEDDCSQRDTVEHLD